MAKTDGKQQHGSVMETKSPQEWPIRIQSNRQTANSNLPCRPLVTPKDTRPRFCNPSSLNSHLLICSLTPAHISLLHKYARTHHTIAGPQTSWADVISLLHQHKPKPLFPLHPLVCAFRHDLYIAHTSLLALRHLPSPHMSLASFFPLHHLAVRNNGDTFSKHLVGEKEQHLEQGEEKKGCHIMKRLKCNRLLR